MKIKKNLIKRGRFIIVEEMDERKIILRRYFDFNQEWSVARKKVVEELGWEDDIDIDEAARNIPHQMLVNLFEEQGIRKGVDFNGRYWSVHRGELRREGSWDTVRNNLTAVLKEEGAKAYAILKALLEIKRQTKENYFDFTERVRELSGKSISWKVLHKLEKLSIVHKRYANNYQELWVPEEIRPLVEEVLEANPQQLSLSTEIALTEFEEIKKMDAEFDDHLKDILNNEQRLESTIRFGESFDAAQLTGYLSMFGELYFDTLLSLIHQYALADIPIVNQSGKTAGYTGFNLAFFGAPGTGKTFAVDDMIRGNDRLNIPPHGLPGRNRYCGGMTPAKFIRIAEAYEGRKFNFIVPEFNDWFKYKGMVEPLKLAMEHREIKYEIKGETVGPYRFSPFFSVNYNTRVKERGYEVTISDPNFNSIEDRMLCILHKMTKDRFLALRESQRRLRLGKIDFELANPIRDHLCLVHAIYTTSTDFPPKPVVLTEDLEEGLSRADEVLLDNVNAEMLSPSVRLADMAVKLAGASKILSYFKEDELEIGENEIKLALEFYIEEMNTRCGEAFDVERIKQEVLL
ncbi:MAG: hypothetical protein ACOCSC_00180 [Candidatus Hadarchaeota archaeon]